MIKRIRLVRRREALSPREFHAAWLDEVARVRRCPAGVRPTRTVACTTLHGVASASTAHDGISLAWFHDLAALRRFDAWLSTEDGRLAEDFASAIEPASSVLIIAEEVVLRGADWLEQRWSEGRTKYKHMALARRAEHLSAEEFSQRWRNRPGKLGGENSGPAIVIPDPAKGRAYVQNHPITSSTQQWTYDAINEVYFEEVEDMRPRIDFFMNHDVVRIDADLVGESSFVAVSEQLIGRA